MQENAQRGLETRSEAVYLDGVTADGQAGVIVRLCRYPQAGFAWAWGHAFVADRMYAFTDHELRCDDFETDPDRDPVDYALSWSGGSTAFKREGPRHAPRSAEYRGTFSAHAARHAPHGNGSHHCRIEAGFRASADAVSNRVGRSEVLGTTRFSIEVGGAALEFSGRGQFHEQIQADPRFTLPFSYLS